VRFRTVGDANCTGAVRSSAATLEAIIDEVALANVSERGATRADGQVLRDRHGRSKTRRVLLNVELATKDLLRLATIGSVDDGKSTLIGRILVDTRQLFDDQLDRRRRGFGETRRSATSTSVFRDRRTSRGTRAGHHHRRGYR